MSLQVALSVVLLSASAALLIGFSGLSRLTTFVVTIGGVVAGFALVPFTTNALRNLVFDVPPLDLRLAAGAASVLTLCALASVYWPARRAGRVAPADLLKAE